MIAKKVKIDDRISAGVNNIHLLKSEMCRRNFYYYVKEFWDVIIQEDPVFNWHIKFLCDELQKAACYLMARAPKPYDLVINIPPGTTKSTVCTEMFPSWCWIAKIPERESCVQIPKKRRYYFNDDDEYFLHGRDLRFITASYSSPLSLEHAELRRDIIKSEKFQLYFPELNIRRDKDMKSNYKNNFGGSAYATSVGGTATGMHAHAIIVDDPLNPEQAVSETGRETANRWLDKTLSSRKVSKLVTITFLVHQRLHQQDCTGHLLEKKEEGKKIRHINLPGMCDVEGFEVYPPELKKNYVDGLLDPIRLNRDALDEMKIDLGGMGYAAQVGQCPRDPKGNMFKRHFFEIVPAAPAGGTRPVRGWDLAGTSEIEATVKKTRPAYTASLRMKIVDGIIYLEDGNRERLSPNGVRTMLKSTASQDGKSVIIDIPQDPGQAGKAQVQSLTALLHGYIVKSSPESGDKIRRAEPFAAQCEAGNVKIVKGKWNLSFINELCDFPNSDYKDWVDACSRAYNRLTENQKRAGVW